MRIMQSLRRIGKEFDDKFWPTAFKLAAVGTVVLLYFFGLYYLVGVVFPHDEPSQQIPNAGFAILAMLAALSFSCSRALRQDSEDKDRFTYAGERLFHAAVFFITVSLLNYGVALMLQRAESFLGNWFAFSCETFVRCVSLILILLALRSAHTGLRILSTLLSLREYRYGDYDSWVADETDEKTRKPTRF